MTYTIDKTALVKCLLVKDLNEVICDGSIAPVGNACSEVVKHMSNLDVSTAVTGTLEGAEGCGNRGICICAGGAYNVSCKCGVITAAVLCVKHQAKVKELCLLVALHHSFRCYLLCGNGDLLSQGGAGGVDLNVEDGSILDDGGKADAALDLVGVPCFRL